MDPSLLVFEGNRFIVGEIPRAIPTPKYAFEAVRTLTSFSVDELAVIVPPALALAVLGAIDSLLTSLVADVATQTRHNSDRELIGQGLGNIISGAFGGFSGAGATVRTLVNVANGGRNRISGVTHGAVLLVVLVALGPIAGWIPMSVLAGILIVTAVNMVDEWSVKLLRKRTARWDAAVVIFVTVITVAVDLMVAVAAGMGVSLMLFIRELTQKGAVRDDYRCVHRRSKRVRSDEEEQALQRHGEELLVYELEGSLFFGVTDQFAKQVETELNDKERETRYLILDLKRVEGVDITGAELIKQIVDKVEEEPTTMLISGFNPYVSEKREAMLEYMRELEVIKTVGTDNIFSTLDDALEYAENELLRHHLGEQSLAPEPIPHVRHCVCFDDLDEEEWGVVEPLLKREQYDVGGVIYKKGEEGGRLCILESGHVSVTVALLDHPEAQYRLATFGPGRHFGDMSFLEGKRRTGTVRADELTVLYSMERAQFEALEREHPTIAIKILRGLVHRLSERLRVTSAELVEMEL
jgi:SulP family sulfate permease